jgi:hypothetical protein
MHASEHGGTVGCLCARPGVNGGGSAPCGMRGRLSRSRAGRLQPMPGWPLKVEWRSSAKSSGCPLKTVRMSARSDVQVITTQVVREAPRQRAVVMNQHNGRLHPDKSL